MSLTREFKETVRARAKRDDAFRQALLAEAIEQWKAGDHEVGLAILRDYLDEGGGIRSVILKRDARTDLHTRG